MSKKNDSVFVTVVDSTTGKIHVEHIENGILIDDLDNMDAARAIAILANLGFLIRDELGDLCIMSSGGDPDVLTLDEFMDQASDQSDDDGPTVEDYDSDAYCPKKSRAGV